MGEKTTLAEETTENPFVARFQHFFEVNYKKQIEKLVDKYPEKRSLEVDFKEIEHFDFELADEILENPDYVLEAATLAIKNVDVPSLGLDEFKPHIRVYNLPQDAQPDLRNIGSDHIGKMITVEGVTVQITDVLPKLRMAVWECKKCGNTYRKPQPANTQEQPSICECRSREFTLKPTESTFEDYQKIRIQEPLESIKGNQQPTNIDIYASDDLVNRVAPGDKIKISGVLRLVPPKEKKLVYGRFVEAVHIEETEKEFNEIEISKEEEEEIKALAKSPDIYEKLVKSIAPNIYGHELVKESVSLQLFGGVKKFLPGNNNIRGNIHVLLVGEPGMAKCVDGETKLLLADGTTQKISEIVEKNLNEKSEKLDDGFYSVAFGKLPTLNENCNFLEGDVIHAIKRKPERMFYLKTASGKELKTTHTHPLFASINGKVKAIKIINLKKGDFIATPRKLQINGEEQLLFTDIKKGKTNALHIKIPNIVDDEVARFVGYILAEGYTRKEQNSTYIAFTNSDKEIVEDLCILTEKLFGLKTSKKFNKKKNAFEIRASSVELYELLKENFPELLEYSKSKQINQKILSSKKEVVKNFLKAFIETEGSIRKTQRTIEVSSASKELIENLSLLLARFEIIGTIKKIQNAATNSKLKIKRDYYRLRIGGKFAEKYVKEIGFISQRKIVKAKNVILNPKNFNTNIDIVPGIANELLNLRKKLELTQYEMGVTRAAYQHYERGERNPSREQLFLIANHLIATYFSKDLFDKEVEEKVMNLFKLAQTDIFWDKIEEVKEIPPNEWVYDVEVSHTHNFVSNMIISHNSAILQAVDKIAPKSIYTTGKNTSAAGLSATAVKDEFGEGGWTLKAGALVLASGGMALIDELDKMDAEDRSALHEAMEQESISVSKAGIVARFKSETSILSAANPKYSRFDLYQNFMEQINLPPTLVSRFDLFFLIRDVLDRKKDEEISHHILKTHRAGEIMLQEKKLKQEKKSQEVIDMEKTITPAINADLLKKYVSYARQNCFPILTKDAMDAISEFYIDLRDQGRKQGTYAATHRQLEAFVRLSEASAKVRLSNSVEIEDAQRAIRLFKAALQDLVVDPQTGKIDFDIINTGRTQTETTQLKKVLQIIKDKSANVEMVPIEEIIEEAKTAGIDEEKTKDIISKLEKAGDIYKPKYKFVKPTSPQK